ncbi:ATP-binding cassette domain-containing protein [Atopobium sp. oral taxon 810]|uniref:ATP-binding cassette domain-containing protein n=1 Tax=Atopobium sp. oral taxon 810 TaxID=712158 RepID=UPI000396AD29|nr:ATP-binding cassette domain-containing protein [Atopobium sp. oral taxon 810]ERI06106.1 bacitracin ABC transporter, ATP-binding protein BcrA family protein [Atopobium sp. oral taxon 810 str. F0209]
MSVEINNLNKTIHGVTILSNISMSMPSGCVTGLAGVNGSGKTMLMRAVAGLIRPNSGTIDIDGNRLWRDISFPPSVGLLIENPAFLDDRTGLENLQILASIKGIVQENALRQALEEVGLEPDDKRKFRKYSLGMKQRLGIAAATMEQPNLLLLDEPTNALDSDGVVLFKHILAKARARGATCIVSCHDASVLREVSDSIYYLAEGHIDGYEELTSVNNLQRS